MCAACEPRILEPPDLPREFWQTDLMHDALATWHMGRVIYAYRTHPFHGRPLAQEMVAGWLNLTQGQLSRLENGAAPEQLSKLIHWAQTLKIPGDLLWFKLPMRNADTLEDVNRQGFLRTAAAITLAPATLLELISTLKSTPVPSTVGEAEIEEIRTAAKQISSWDAADGRGLVREAVLAQLRHAVRLLDANATPKDKAELRSAVGFLSHTAGFMAFDRYEHTDARAMFQLALDCAEKSNDWSLRAKVLSSMARQSIWRGDLEDGLTSVELAFVRSDRLTATERAMLHTTKARALAKLGRVQDTVTEVGRADDEFARARPDNDPAWMKYYDLAQHSGDTGHALYDLAMGGAFATEARHRLATAVNGHTDAYRRSRAISGIKLSSLVMALGDPQEATTIATRALTDAKGLRSHRAADDLRDLQRFAARRIDQPGVAKLSNRIKGLVAI
ncbi:MULTISPECIES: XRE family transcriptional regulator [Nocardia]|uniref:XRE family transcriptional regulator n=1 Tax=Nocardia TaxID=1817 RepID=UPI002B4B050C|nr:MULTISPECIES: XRE family transcriptional regulator [Nocardia]